MNVVLVLGDDWPIDAEQGLPWLTAQDDWVVMDGMCVTITRCSPDRAVMHTGQLPLDNGVNSNESAPFPDGRETIGAVLQRAGVDCYFVGKFSNVHGEPDGDGGFKSLRPGNYFPPGWKQWLGNRVGAGYESANVNDNGHLQSFKEVYSPDWQKDRIVEWIEDRDTEKPFFIMWCVGIAHQQPGEQMMADRHIGAFTADDLVRQPNFNPADGANWSTMPQWLQDDQPTPLDTGDVDDIDEDHANALCSLLALGGDGEALEQIVATLTSEGILEDTVIIVLTDNGNFYGEHRLEDKGAFFHEARHAHCRIRWPGVEGRTETGACSSVDIPVTITSLLGGVFPHEVAGLDLTPLVVDGTPIREACWVEDHTLSPVGQRYYAAVVPGESCYVLCGDGEELLFDLANDPYELVNLAASSTPSHVSRLTSMRDTFETIKPANVPELPAAPS